MVNVARCAEHLSVSEATVYRWARDAADPMPSHKIHGRLLFKLSEVDAWLDGHDGDLD